jgi:hypothetical protein
MVSGTDANRLPHILGAHLVDFLAAATNDAP